MNKTTLLIWINLILVLAMWLMACWIYNDLPERYPSHFNWEEKSERWGEKNPLEFCLLPTILTVIIGLILVLLRYPQFYNFPQKKEVREWPEEFRRPVYEYLNQGILIAGILLCTMFIYIEFVIGEFGKSSGVGNAGVWIIIAITMIWLTIIVIFIVRVNKVVKEMRLKLDEGRSDSS